MKYDVLARELHCNRMAVQLGALTILPASVALLAHGGISSGNKGGIKVICSNVAYLAASTEGADYRLVCTLLLCLF